MVEVCNISKSFGKQKVLHDVNFVLKKGEVVAFLGANGAGKTTTMSIITGILPPDTGAVRIDGLNLNNPIEYKSKIGYLSENNPLYGDMYVGEYLEYVAKIYNIKENTSIKVSEIIERVDLSNESKKKIRTLSHGNRQRVGLAQTLIHDPEILILDEPSTGLDPIQQLKINDLIKELGKTKTILFSSHRLDDVSDIATRYLVLRDGTLVLDKPAGDIDSIKEYFFALQ